MAKAPKKSASKPARVSKRAAAKGASTIRNSTLSNPSRWLVEWAQGGDGAASGESVNERTALGLSAYLACIKNISEDIGKLPLGIHKKLNPRGCEYQDNHPVTRLLHDQPNPEMTAMVFRETITQHALGWHGGFAEIVRDGGGVPRELWPLDPCNVERKRDFGVGSPLYYLVYGQRFEANDIFDIHGLSYNGLTGYVLSRLAKDPLGNALAAQKFVGSFFGNGTVTTGVLQVPMAMSETAFKHLRESFHERHSGGKNQHKPIILEEGTTWNAQTTSAKDSQMQESIWDGIEQVCRLFRMPPHKIQHLLRATFSNIEMQALEYVVDALLGWAVRWEQEIWRKLLLPQERKNLFAKHNFNMLLRGDMAGRSAFYREMSNVGALCINDIRDKEDMNPIEGGDTHFVNAAMVPLEMASKGEHLAAKQAQSSPDTPPQDPETPAEPDKVPPPDAPSDAAEMWQSEREHKRELLGRIAAAHTKAIEKELAATLRIEHDKVTRAAKRPGFQDWAGEFYGQTHREQLKTRLSAPILALQDSLAAVAGGGTLCV